jgi:hypothetical protein
VETLVRKVNGERVKMQITCGVLASRLSKMPPDAEVRILLNENGEERELAITETAVPRQNDDQLLNQHLAGRPVTLLNVKFSCS